MKNFLDNILGTQDVAYFFAALFFAFIGVTISLLIHSTNRDKDAVRTPFKFDLAFLFSDNAKRILLNLILILITIRFYEDIRGEKLTMIGAVTVGVAYDKLAEWLRNMNIIDKH